MTETPFKKNLQYYKFCAYGFLKNLRFFDFFLILFFSEDKGLEYTLIMSLYAIKFITRTIMEIPSGVIADSLGRKKTLQLSFAGYILSFIIYFLSDSYILLIAASAIYGFGDAFRTGTHKAMIFEYLNINHWKNQKVTYYGHTRSWSQVGSAVSSLIGALMVIITGNYTYIFLFSTIPYVLGMIILSTYPPSIDKEITAGNHSVSRKIILRSGETFKALKDIRNNFSLFRVSAFSGYYLAVKDLIQPMIVNLSLTFPLLYALDKTKMSAIWIGVIYFFIYIISAFSSKYSGHFLNRFKYYYKALDILFFAGLVFGIISGLATSNENYLWPVLLMIFVYAIENIRKPIGVSCLGSIYNSSITATILSISSQLGSILAALIAILLGITIDRLGFGKGFALTSLFILILYILLITGSKFISKDAKNHPITTE